MLPGESLTRISAEEPDYAGMIAPMQLRRMSKAVRMGIGAAKSCLAQAGTGSPDAIAVGTTMGCLQDTEVFLKKMVTQEERMLTPTSFIQSTHNTVAGQIALVTGCHGYNTTICQRGHSFEGAVMSAALYLAEHPEHTVLCGGVDELTDTSFDLMQRAGADTSIAAGEGAGFLLLSRTNAGGRIRIAGLDMFSGMNDADALARVGQCVSGTGGSHDNIVLWLGLPEAAEELFTRQWSNTQSFKKHTGNWGTATAVALGQAVISWPEGAEKLLIINQYCGDWSVWLLERA